MKFKYIALLAGIFICSQQLTGQDVSILKKSGEEFLAALQYKLALEAFLKYEQARPGDASVAANTGICYFQLNDLEKAENYLNQSFQIKNTPPEHTLLYLGKLHHAKLDFEQAATFYKKFLQKTPGNHPLRAAVKDDIRRCANGIRIRRQAPVAAVVNLGEVINSTGDDFKPILSPNNSERLYFSSARPGNAGCAGGECKADMFFTTLSDGDWGTPQPLSIFLNSIQNDVALDFSKNGSLLYFFRGETLYSGDILVDTFRANVLERTLFSPELESPMIPWNGDRSLNFFNDTILLFSSRRAGGFGGLDLYVSTFRRGHWSLPQNLGPTVNSPYDETSPFLAVDGRTLYFSSNDARRSMGGMDIFRSIYLDHVQRWSPPENLGNPVNSAADDEQFVLSASGSEAFFASARKQGLGERDLYVTLFDQPRPEQAAVSLPIAFHLVPSYQAALSGISESAGPPPEDFFEEITSFELPVLSLPGPAEPLPEESLKNLQLLAVLMKKFPEMKVSVAIHTAAGDDSPSICENAFRRVELCLRQEGVSVQNLALRCAGSSWPVDPKQPEANRRMEIFIANPDVLPFEARRREPPQSAFDARFFQKTMTSLCYLVVVNGNSLTAEGDLEKLRSLYPKGMLEERPAQNRLFFTLGIYLTYPSADEWRKKLQQDGYREARIAAYLNGWEISKTEAAQYVEQFPDLKNFIEN